MMASSVYLSEAYQALAGAFIYRSSPLIQLWAAREALWG